MNIKENAAKQIREYLDEMEMSQADLVKFLAAKKYDIDKTRVSRLLKGEGTESVFRVVCGHLGLSDPGLPPLRAGFASGFWSAPLIAKLEETNKTTTDELLKYVKLTAYESVASKKEDFNKNGKPLERYSRENHNFYFSGEILDKLKHKKIDIGFMGGTLAQKHAGKILRVARICDASSSRHAILVVAPAGSFDGQTHAEREKQAIRYLVNAPEAKEAESFAKKPKCLFLFQDESTSELEFELLFQPANHRGEAIQILNTKSFVETFREKVIANQGKIIAQIALMLTVDAAEVVSKALNEEGLALETFKFRTSAFFEVPAIKEKLGWTARDFSFDMVILRERVNEIIQHPGFFSLVEYLDVSTAKLTDAKKQIVGSTPRVFQNVIDFYGLDDRAVERMRETEFGLLYYPDFMNIMRDMLKVVA